MKVRNGFPWAIVSLLTWIAGCNNGAVTDGGANPDASAGACLPPDVASELATRCQTCHASPPRYGAPMPLVTFANTQASVVDDQAAAGSVAPVWQLMQRRMNDAAHPMPPGGVLPANELAMFNNWFAAGAQASSVCGGDAGSDAAVDAGPPIGPDALPCPASERTSYLAHGPTGASGFTVPRDAGNLYECFTWRSPFSQPTQATAFAATLGDVRVLHHYILFQTATPQVDGGVGPCHMPADAVFVSGWAPGAGNYVLPPSIGLDLPGTDHWFILQVHYHNIAGYTDAVDASGVTMCTTSALRDQHASVHTLGSLNIALPPHTANVTTTGRCTPASTQPVHVVSASPHMHVLGTTIETVVLRGGDPAQSETLVQVPHWDFETQHPYLSSMVINPGDVLNTTCQYNNTTDGTVYFGENTEDEMCFDFVMAWPAGGLTNAVGASANRCIDRVP